MLIVADENIPLLDECFAGFGEIRRYPGRAISAEQVRDAEVLLVRSVTRVDRALLAGSRVRFVGTCTIGTDHLDLPYFDEAGIGWSSAPGCNARGVVDYVLGSLLTLAERTGKPLSERVYGVVGAGQVGDRLARVLKALGWQVRVCDPPRQRAEGGDFVPLAQLLAECDVISLHTPLTRDGEDASWHLLGASELAALKPGTWLINASRGPVVDNAALLAWLQAGGDLQVVLDVWEHEPVADPALAALCQLATPHIAGYSLDGKLRGTYQVYEAFCRWQGQPPAKTLGSLMPEPWLAALQVSAQGAPDWLLAQLCRSVYDPRLDDANFRRTLVGSEAERRLAFDQLRKHYPYRREIDGLKVMLSGENADLRRLVEAVGAQAL